MEKLFEFKKEVTTVAATDDQIIFTKAPLMKCEQFLLDKNFRQYLETIMASKKIYLRIGVQKRPIQNTYEISTGSDPSNIKFLGSNRQFE